MAVATKFYETISPSNLEDITHQMFNDYCSQSIPTDEEVTGLADKIQQGSKEAEDELVVRNMRLVISIACKYQAMGLAVDDLIQEGAIGLIRAAKKYDPTRGFKFSTMATWWIKQQIHRSIMDKGDTIRIPVHLHDTTRQITNYYHKVFQEEGVYPDKKQTLKHFKIDGHIFDRAMNAMHIQPYSLNKVVEDGSEIGELIEDNVSVTPEDELSNTELREHFEKALSILNENEKIVIKKRFGWDDGISMTLEETAKYVINPCTNKPITRERVRQIETKAIAKLRANADGLSEWA